MFYRRGKTNGMWINDFHTFFANNGPIGYTGSANPSESINEEKTKKMYDILATGLCVIR